jgi:3-oxoadipate CoA-transferase, beta subunit
MTMTITMAETIKGWTMQDVAGRLAADLKEGWAVNLGIGLPTLVANAIPVDKEVLLHSENGILGIGPKPASELDEDPDLINAGKQAVTLHPGGSYFSQSDSFAMIRGGHLDAAVLGAFQVSQYGDLANWKLPGSALGQVGGAMDLALGSKHVFVMMEHSTRKGEPKIVDRCSFPLTGARCVSRIYTNLAIIDVTDSGLAVREIAPGVSLTELQAATGAPLLSAAAGNGSGK